MKAWVLLYQIIQIAVIFHTHSCINSYRTTALTTGIPGISTSTSLIRLWPALQVGQLVPPEFQHGHARHWRMCSSSSTACTGASTARHGRCQRLYGGGGASAAAAPLPAALRWAQQQLYRHRPLPVAWYSPRWARWRLYGGNPCGARLGPVQSQRTTPAANIVTRYVICFESRNAVMQWQWLDTPQQRFTVSPGHVDTAALQQRWVPGGPKRHSGGRWGTDSAFFGFRNLITNQVHGR